MFLCVYPKNMKKVQPLVQKLFRF